MIRWITPRTERLQSEDEYDSSREHYVGNVFACFKGIDKSLSHIKSAVTVGTNKKTATADGNLSEFNRQPFN